MRLKDDPGIEELLQKVLQGRIAERKLKLLNLLTNDEENEIVCDDFVPEHELLQINQSEFLWLLSKEEIEVHEKSIEDGKNACKVAVAFHD